MAPTPNAIDVIAPNLKRRLSGVTSTIVRLVPVQAREIGIVATGPGLPKDLPHIPLWRVAFLGRNRLRVWHARRNTEMLAGLFFARVLRRRMKLLFTSAAQRRHSGYTRWLIRQMDAVVATSPQAASFLERPATVIMHGVDTAIFRPETDKPALRHELSLPVTGSLIGCFGRLRAQKGTDVLVDAALSVLRHHPDATLVFTGRETPDQKDFMDRLRDRIGTAGLTDRILFLGELPWPDLVRHYRALDLFVAPARWEGFGLTPLEAMASGVPVIATTVGAFQAQVVDGVTGTLVAPGDAEGLGAALRAMLADPTALARAGRESRTHVEANFAIEREAAALIAVYRDLLKDTAK
jgi:mannosyltransferase